MPFLLYYSHIFIFTTLIWRSMAPQALLNKAYGLFLPGVFLKFLNSFLFVLCIFHIMCLDPIYFLSLHICPLSLHPSPDNTKFKRKWGKGEGIKNLIMKATVWPNKLHCILLCLHLYLQVFIAKNNRSRLRPLVLPGVFTEHSWGGQPWFLCRVIMVIALKYSLFCAWIIRFEGRGTHCVPQSQCWDYRCILPNLQPVLSSF